MSEQTLYTIGKFAKISGVSVKQLRYLEEKKILIPKERDKYNNYRYYSQSQLERLVFIKTLRDMEVPFEQIVPILQSHDLSDCIGMIKRHMESTDQHLKKLLHTYQQSAEYLMRLIEGHCLAAEYSGIENGARYSIIEVPKQTILYTRLKSRFSARELFLDRFFELKNKSFAHNAALGQNMSAVFHDGYMRQFDNLSGDLETFFPLASILDCDNCAREFGGFEGVSGIFVGHYRNLEAFYMDMKRWSAENDIELMDISIETYLLGPDLTIIPERYITQVVIPLAGSKV